MTWLALACSFALLAQEAPPPAVPTDDPPPSLDELLGLDEEKEKANQRTIDAERDRADLERLLADDPVTNAFEAALGTMRLVVARLAEALDTGIETQRAQQDVLDKLDSLVEEARKQQSQGQRSSSRRSSSSQSSQSPPSSPDSGRSGQAQPGEAQPAPGDRTGEPTEGEPPAMRQGDIATALDETREEWGSLPERVRGMLLQGRRERFSSLYERLTREYYKRLAEDER